MKDFQLWFEKYATDLSEAVELITAAGLCMSEDKIKPRTAIRYIQRAHVILTTAGKSVEPFVDKKKKKGK
jgi:hypothetical protein